MKQPLSPKSENNIRTVNLPLERYIRSPQQCILLLRHGDFEPDVQYRWKKSAQEIARQNRERSFSWEATIRHGNINWVINTGVLYRSDQSKNCVERHVFLSWRDYDKIRDPHDHGKIIAPNENQIIADLIFYICRQSGKAPESIRTVYHVFNAEGDLLYRHPVDEEIAPLEKIEEYVRYRLEAFAEDMDTPEKDLPPCHSSYTGRHFEQCLHFCPARFRCEQRKTNLQLLKSRPLPDDNSIPAVLPDCCKDGVDED